MLKFKKTYRQLYKAYKKRLNKLHKTSSLSLEDQLDYLVTYLKLIRDYFILTESIIKEDGTENFKIATLATAIAEYEQYKSWSKNIEDVVNSKAINKDNEAIIKKYSIEKQIHFEYFWDLLKQNILTWGIKNDTV